MEYDRLGIKKSGNENVIDRDRMINIRYDAGRIDLGEGEMLEPRVIFEFKTHAIFLPSIYDWVIGTDSHGARCLVPLKKKEDTK